MKNDRNVLLNMYLLGSYLLFGFLLFENFRVIRTDEWVEVVTFAGIAGLFKFRDILLPSGQTLSLFSTLLFTAGILYGELHVFYIVVLMAIIFAVNKPKSWNIILFNSVQLGLSAYVGIKAYKFGGGVIGSFHLANSGSYLAFVLAYFIINVLLISSFMSIQNKMQFKDAFMMLLDRESVIIYFTMMTLGLLMAIVLQAEGLTGVIIFSIVLSFLGITYRHYYEMYEHFRSLSIKDELTGLYNHRYFQEKLQELLTYEKQVSLLLMDLDYFKIYNDMYGHPQGDRLLKEVSKVISTNMPENGTFCRYGGEEFAILLPGIDSEDALHVAEIIRKEVAEYSFYGMEHMPRKNITVSIGVSTYPDMANNKETLIMLADEALYKVKYTSRNKVQLYSSVIDELKSSFQFGDAEMELIQTIKTLLTIINSKDRYTYGHTERDMEYAEALARKIGLPEEEIKYIRYGALLHDIGKVEVPTEILNKRTRLTQEEWEIMKMHVVWGEEIVRPIKELARCLPIIRHHHERFDGKGYPDGLASTDIPLPARILTVVDSFDAMTTNRPYQKTKSIAEAIEELRLCKGTQFDPDLVEPFVEVLKELRPIQEKKEA